MKKSGVHWYALAGGAAGLVNGFFGGGGGMVLVPLLAGKCGLDQRRAFATSIAIIAPLCALSASIYYFRGGLDPKAARLTWPADWWAAWWAGRYLKSCLWYGCAEFSPC